jgi:cellulose synthase/poly-beta-1,6-N-acetylglucosamine synthase-like glycosyltransferase
MLGLLAWAALALSWLAFGALGAVFVGYPVAMALLAKLSPKPYPSGAQVWDDREGELPHVALVLAAHNEAARLPAKLASLQALDYPHDKLRFYVADDASTDETWEVLRRLQAQEPRLSLVRAEENVGKPTNINRLVREADPEASVLVFNDARQALHPQALKALLAPLQDPKIGGATGDLVLPPNPDGSMQGMGAYWRYETWIRTNEALTGSVVGATGALYAVRRACFVPHEPDLVLDDMTLPLRVAMQGHRFVFARGALAYDTFSASLDQESRRKARTLGGIWQAIEREPRLVRPGAGMTARFVGHKLGRALLPWLVAAALIGAWTAVPLLMLDPDGPRPVAWALAALMLLGQAAFHGGAALAAWAEAKGKNPGPLRIVRTLHSLMSAAWRGWRLWRRGELTAAWKRPSTPASHP